MKTVRELANEIGVSKQAVARYIRSHKKEVNKHLTKEKQTFLLDEELQKTIKQHFERNRYKRTDNTKMNQQQTESEPVQTDNEPIHNQQQEIIDILKKQVEQQQKELETRNREIEKVHSLLDQQQRLTLQTNSNNELLREENERLKVTGSEVATNQQQTESEPIQNQQQTDTSKTWWKFWK